MKHNKIQLLNDLLDFSSRSFVFGGFVRDLLAGDEPRDIDFACQESSIDDIIQYLTEKDYKFILTKKNADLNLWHFASFKVGEIDIEVSITDKNCKYQPKKFSPIWKPDADVNMLAYNKHKIWSLIDNIDKNDIIKNIFQRKFISFGFPERDEKLIKKGYVKLGVL